MDGTIEYRCGDNICISAGQVMDEATRLHELSHHYLMKATHWGVMTYLQGQLRRADRLYAHAAHHFAVGRLLMQAAEITFESHATLNQLLYAKGNDQELFAQLKDSLYYQIYNKTFFNTFLSIDLPRGEVAYLGGRLPELALATDLYEVSPENWLSQKALADVIMDNPLQYHPDTRFNLLVNAYVELRKKTDPHNISDQKLIDYCGLKVKTIQFGTARGGLSAFRKIINVAYKKERCIQEAFSVIDETLELGDTYDLIENKDYMDTPLPLETDFETEAIKELKPWLNNCQVMVLLPYEETVVLQYHQTTLMKRYVLKCTWSALLVLFAKFENALVLFDEDYSYIKLKFPYIHQRRAFFFYGGTYYHFRDCLRDKEISKPPLCMIKVNDAVICLFVWVDNNEMLFSAQNIGSIVLILHDIEEGLYKYVNTGDMDDVFSSGKLNWGVYEDVIKSVLHVKHIDGRCNIQQTGYV